MTERNYSKIIFCILILFCVIIFLSGDISAGICLDTWLQDNSHNPIVNYGFEQTPDFAGWISSTNPIGVTTSIDYLTGHDGTSTKAAMVTWDGSNENQNYWHTSQTIPVIGGRTYSLTGFIKTYGITCEACGNSGMADWNGVRILIWDPNKPYVPNTPWFNSSTKSLYGTTPWTYVSTEFTTPNDTTQIIISLRRFIGPLSSNQSGRSWGSAWWDDIQLLPVPKITDISINGNLITISGESFGNDPGAGNRSSAENCVLVDGNCIADNYVQSWSDDTVIINDPGNGAIRIKSGGIVSNVISAQNVFTLQNNTISIDFPDLSTGQGIGQITHIGSGREFLNGTVTTSPLYEFTVKKNPFDPSSKTIISSKDASSITKTYTDMNGIQTLTVTASHCNEFIVTATITLPSFQGGAQFSINIQNNGTRAIQSVRYPIIAANPSLGNDPSDDAIIFPYFEGYLVKDPSSLATTTHYKDNDYPGSMPVQMMAYYDAEQPNAGLYLSMDDNQGNKKRFGFERINDSRGNYNLFSFLHSISESSGNQFALTYHVNIDTFSGDWIDAAERYKQWALTQPWTAIKLTDRTDVPAWLYNIKAMIDCYNCRPENSNAYNYEALVSKYRNLLGIPQEGAGVSNFMLYPGGFWGFREGDYNSCHVDWSGIDYFTDDPYYNAATEPGDPPYVVLKDSINALRNNNTDVLLFIEGLTWDEYFYKIGGGLPSCQTLLAPDPSVDPIPAGQLCFDDRTHFFSRVDSNGVPYIIQREDGSPLYSFTWPSNDPNVCHLTEYMCVGTDDADSAMDLVLYNNIRRGIDHGARLMSLDAIVGGRIPGCWASHGHPIGEGKWTHDRFVQILNEINRIIDQEKNKRGEFGFAMENANELYLQNLQFQYVRNSELDSNGGNKKIPLFNYIYKGYYLGVDRGNSFGGSNNINDRWSLAMDFIQGTVQGTMVASDPAYQPNADIVAFYKRLVGMKRPEAFYKAESLYPPVFYGLPNEVAAGLCGSYVNGTCTKWNTYYFDPVLTNVLKTSSDSISYLLVNINTDGTGSANINFDITQYDLPFSKADITIIKEGINGRTQETFTGETLPYPVSVNLVGGEAVEVRVESVDGGGSNCEIKTTFYRDADGDGYGEPNDIIYACAQPSGYVANNIDCDDNKLAIYPRAAEVCDGVDNNCDGQIDEGIAAAPTTCGAGACARTGQNICQNGTMVDTCTPGTPQPEVCDGVDNNCDGQIDEGIATTPTTCGVGACARAGQNICQNGTMIDTCTPGQPTAEICNGIDNNCDGTIAECNPSDWYNDGSSGQWRYRQTINIAAKMTNANLSNFPVLIKLNNPNHPVFTFAQSDYDDIVFTAADGTTQLPHEIEKYDTVAGILVAWVKMPVLSSSGNAIFMYYGNGSATNQQNKNAVWDSGYVMVQHFSETTGTHYDSTSNANDGTPQNGVNQNATGKIGGADSFDGVDDYVTVTDPGMSSLDTTSAFTISVWINPNQISLARYGVVSKRKNTITRSGYFLGLDNEGWCDDNPLDTNATIGFHYGEQGGIYAECGNQGVVSPNEWTYITVTYNASGDARAIYKNGVLQSTSSSRTISTIESNDQSLFIGKGHYDLPFNGTIDEVRISNTAHSAERIAAEYNNQNSPGSNISFATQEIFCTDSDHDGYAVEGGACGPADCNDSNAAINPSASDANCDGIDNNCNGQTDEGYAPTPTTCGQGVCSATGQNICQNGQIINTCTPGQPTGNDDNCNGIDENCNGTSDENFAPSPTSCGQGVCAATGQNICQSGQIINTCTAGQPTGNDDNCNGLDENCNGTADENYAPPQTSCGTGACASTGQLICQNGSTSDTCIPGQPQPESCDGADNNCDGTKDENLTRATTCGVGACSGNAGIETCSAGIWGNNTCDPFAGSTPEVCDNIDNDCNGGIDDNLTRPTSCGIGACSATGNETCTAGAWGNDTCTPGTPQREGYHGDLTCSDTSDNDCDGATDLADTGCKTVDLIETYVSNPPSSIRRGNNFSVTDTVLNQGGTSSGASTTRYYLSLDTIRNTGDKQLTNNRSVPALTPDATSNGTVSVKVPSNTTPGTYYLLSCADDKKVVAESSETNNCIASSATVTVTY